MSGRFARAWSLRMVACVVMAAAAWAISAAPALAGTLTWVGVSPANGSTVTNGGGGISATVDGSADIPLPQTMLLDGVPLTSYGTYAELTGHWESDGCDTWWVVDTWDYTYLTLSAYNYMTDGLHTASASVTDAQGSVASTNWSFTVAQTPGISSVTPESVTSTTTPVIRVAFYDNPGTHTCLLKVNGVVVPTTQVGSAFEGKVPSPLLDGAMASASVTITDQGGRSITRNWSFRVFTADQISAVITPASGSTIANSYPQVSCVVSDAYRVSKMNISVDGKPSYSAYVLSIDATHWQGTYYPGTLADGPHSVVISIVDTAGNTKQFASNFQVNQPPTVGASSPGGGERIESTMPLISGWVSDNAATIASAVMKVDGVVVPASISGLSVRYTPTTPLQAETSHSVWVSVTDVAGNQATGSWSFWIEKYPRMAMMPCATCHPAYPQPHIDRNCDEACHSSGHGEGPCGDCHGGHDLASCSSCHAQGSDGHETSTGTPHVTSTVMTTCSPCHSTSLSREHARRKSTGGAALTCTSCHGASAPLAVRNAVAANDTRCVACHVIPDHRAVHASPTTTSCFGAGCHPSSRNLIDAHALYAGAGSERAQFDNECDLCHANAAVNVSTSGKSCTPACHSGSTHSQYSSAHAVTSASSSCTRCHGTDLAAAHGAGPADWTRCGICHDSRANWSKNAECASCHEFEGHESLHDTTPGSGQIRLFSATSAHTVREHVGGITQVDCGLCHGKNLLKDHQSVCGTCHDGADVAASVGSWDKSCTDGACHPTYHDRSDSAHDAAYFAGECETCHDPTTWYVPQARCGSCHDVQDIVAPVTTSDAKAVYGSSPTIRLTPTDPAPSSGSVVTRWRLNGGAETVGSLVTIPSTPGETKRHAIEFWSTDGAGNAEARKTLSVLIDRLAPITTSDALSTYPGAATVRLVGADEVGGSGVKTTYYRIDGNGPYIGTVATVSSPGSHTLTFWSLDAAGNVESPRTASFTIAAAPVSTGTICFAWDEPFGGSWAQVWIGDASGKVVATRSAPQWDPAGWFVFSVPVSNQAYMLSAHWYDALSETDDWSYGSALVNSPGKTVTWWY